MLVSVKPEKTKIKGNKAFVNENFTTGPVSQEFNLGHEQDHTDSAAVFCIQCWLQGNCFNLDMEKWGKLTRDYYFFVVK